MELKDDPIFQYFLGQKDLKPTTIKKYYWDLKHYTVSTSMTLTEVIDQARYEEKNIEYLDQRTIPLHFINFKKYLKNRGMSDYSIKNNFGTVRAFYSTFDITLPKMKIEAVPATFFINVDELPSYEDITEFIKNCNIKHKALHTHLASTGMSIGDTLSLTVQKLVDGINYYPEYNINTLSELYQVMEKSEGLIPVWRIARKKSRTPLVTFSTPESLTMLYDYFKRNPPESFESPIFRINSADKGLSYSAVRMYNMRLNKKIFQDRKLGHSRFITAKSFRTFFAITLERYKIPDQHIRRMMGHRQIGIRQSYQKLNISLLMDFYKSALEGLTFLEDVQVVDHTAEELKAWNEEKNALIQETIDMRKDLEDYKNEVLEIVKREIERKGL